MNYLLKKTSDSLICPERPERIAHIRSFVMSDLSDLLTVAHLSWATWANSSHSLICPEGFERMSKWAMNEWANSQPWIISGSGTKRAVVFVCVSSRYLTAALAWLSVPSGLIDSYMVYQEPLLRLLVLPNFSFLFLFCLMKTKIRYLAGGRWYGCAFFILCIRIQFFSAMQIRIQALQIWCLSTKKLPVTNTN